MVNYPQRGHLVRTWKWLSAESQEQKRLRFYDHKELNSSINWRSWGDAWLQERLPRTQPSAAVLILFILSFISFEIFPPSILTHLHVLCLCPPSPPHSVSLSLSLCLCLSPSVCLSPTLPTKEIKSGLCWQTASGLGPALEYVRQATPLEKTASQFPSSTRMSIAPQLGTTLYPPTLLHSEIFVPLELL